MVGPNGIADDTPGKSETFDPGNIFDVQHAATLREPRANSNLTKPLTGMDHSIQICSTSSTANDVLNMAILAACKIG